MEGRDNKDQTNDGGGKVDEIIDEILRRWGGGWRAGSSGRMDDTNKKGRSSLVERR